MAENEKSECVWVDEVCERISSHQLLAAAAGAAGHLYGSQTLRRT